MSPIILTILFFDNGRVNFFTSSYAKRKLNMQFILDYVFYYTNN